MQRDRLLSARERPTLLHVRRRHGDRTLSDPRPSLVRANVRATRAKKRRALTNQPVAFPETILPTISGKAGKLSHRRASCASRWIY